PAKRDRFFPSLGVWSVRGRDVHGSIWELAAKGGHNSEHHNHNDVGSFILNIDGVPIITEAGMPEYTGSYFDPKYRYGHLAARTLGHSLPVINGHEQQAGADFRGTVLRNDLSGSPVTFEADLTKAYPAAAECRRFIRRFTLDKEQGVMRWVDEITLHTPGTIESASLTDAEDVELETPRLAVIRKQGKIMELHCEEGPGWNEIEVLAYQAHDGQSARFRRLVQSTRPGEVTNMLTTSIVIKMRAAKTDAA
ncbi:MAG: heparinase II/III family protein, partial [Rariglobus sp.]